MLYTHVTGGLGNQMFIYATARSISIKNNTKLKLDISAFNTYRRPFLLKKFNIKENYLSSKELEKIEKLYKPSSFTSLFDKFKPYNKRFLRKEKQDFIFFPEVLKLNSNQNVYIKGFWQNEKYFLDIRENLLNEFTLKDKYRIQNTKLTDKIYKSNSVSIHIRRTDSVVKKNYGALPVKHYQEAVRIISNKIKNPHFFVFSDEINWAENNLKINYPTTFVSKHEGLEDYQELIAMSLCKNNIIANSTFSWWGAWLNQNENKIIISPKKYFANDKHDTSDLYPKNWIQLEVK